MFGFYLMIYTISAVMISLTALIIFLIFFFHNLTKNIKSRTNLEKSAFLYNNYDVLLTILTNAINIAFEKVYIDFLSNYNLNYEKSPENILVTAERQYTEIVYMICGNDVMDKLLEIHGGEESLLSLLISEFNKRMDMESQKIASSILEKNVESDEEFETIFNQNNIKD